MKTKVFSSYSEARSFVDTLCKAYSTILDQHLISHDADIELGAMDKVCYTCDDLDWIYWIGIRTRGVEGYTHKSLVKTKIEALHDTCICAIKVTKSNGVIEVCYKQNQLNF